MLKPGPSSTNITFPISRNLGIDLLFLSLGALLFTLAHPNPLVTEGVGGLGFLVLLPVAWVLSRSTDPRLSIFYGAFFGWLTYALFNHWLAAFNPVAWFLVPVIYMLYHMALFPVLALVVRWKSGASVWLAPVVWVAYEYLRTLGYLGYGYGNLGYTQYSFLPWIQSAEWAGVWIVTFLTSAPAFLLNRLLVDERPARFLVHGLILGGLALANLGWGLFNQNDYSGAPVWRAALIQHDMDPWIGGLTAYKNGFERLRRLSEQSLEEHPQVVIWSETAFVPSIEYHRRYRPDPMTWSLVSEFLAFTREFPVPLILGNGHGERTSTSVGFARVDSNAVLHYQGGELRGLYKKNHLVPFTEHFPYGDLFPWFRDFLLANDVHFWTPGSEWSTLNIEGVEVGTPICFEDTFGYIGREFVRRGAQVLINLTNDSWSRSLSNMRQHYSMAVFRAIENRRSLLRATNGGWTAAIDPIGRPTAELPPLTQGFLIAEVPIISTSTTTFYTEYGDWFAIICLSLGLGGVAALIVLRLTKGASWFTIETKESTE